MPVVGVLLASPGGADATFEPPVEYPSVGGMGDVVTADLDGDQDIDLALTNPRTSSVTVLLNQGDGTFGPPSTFTDVPPEEVLGGPLPDPTCVDDFDNDGDALVDEFEGACTRVPSSGLVAADLDGDGDTDLAVGAARDDAGIRVLVNDGHAAFGLGPVLAVSGRTRELAAADLERDDDIDLVATSTAGQLVVFRNDALGAFAPPTAVDFEGDPHGIAIADLDVDGQLDVAMGLIDADPLHDAIVVLAKDASGELRPVAYQGIDAVPQQLTAADVDGDGDSDLAATTTGAFGENSAFGTAITVLHNDGAGMFAPAIHHDVGPTASRPTAADLDADGDTDLAVVRDTGEPTVLSNHGDGTFPPPTPSPAPTPLPPAAADLDVAELDGDGDLDAVVARLDESVAGVTVLLQADDQPPPVVFGPPTPFGDAATVTAPHTPTSFEPAAPPAAPPAVQPVQPAQPAASTVRIAKPATRKTAASVDTRTLASQTAPSQRSVRIRRPPSETGCAGCAPGQRYPATAILPKATHDRSGPLATTGLAGVEVAFPGIVTVALGVALTTLGRRLERG